MGYYDSQGLAPQGDIETASATTSPNNDGSWAFTGIIVAVAIVLCWLFILTASSCTAATVEATISSGGSTSPYHYEYEEGNGDLLDQEEFQELFELLNNEGGPQSQGQGRPRA